MSLDMKQQKIRQERNLWLKSGARFVQNTEGRPWLIQLHCVNHRAELAAKSVLEPAFKEIDSLYKSIRKLLNKSGRIKSDLQTTCNTLNITHYVLPKIYGTRFLHQRRAGFKRFIHMWIPLLTTFSEAGSKTQKPYPYKTQAKMSGFVKKMKNVDNIVSLSVYSDILEMLGLMSLCFEKKELLVCDIEPACDKTMSQLNILLDKAACIDSLSTHFSLVSENHKVIKIKKEYVVRGHERRKKKRTQSLTFLKIL